MGNLQSTSTKNDNHRSNRLSKPLTRKFTFSSPHLSRPEYESPELASGLIGWQNPWAGSTISDVKNVPGSKMSEVPTTRIEPEPASREGATEISVSPRDALPPRSSSLSAASAGKRASQPVMSPPSSLSISPEQPRRANSVHISLQRQRSVIYDNAMEDAASSNTHFLVGNQRFSLTRRRSLLTRPGVATRRTTGAFRRMPSPIGEPEMDDSESTLSNWYLPPRQRPPLASAPPARPTSPADARYTQLGALKLGSLRVVNGSASPCPSERVPLNRPPGLGLEAIQTTCPATLEPCSVSDMKRSDDAPGSPFSFEKSPTIAVPPRGKTILRELDDEGIAMCDESQLEKCPTEIGLDRSTSRSLNKSDSGYSSATSLRSIQGSRTRTSFDSQTSVSCTTDEKIQLHLGLQENPPGHYSRPRPTSHRWYDNNGVNVQLRPGTRTRRSTLCAPRYTEYPTQKDLAMKSSNSPCPFTFQEEQTVSNRASLYVDRYSVTTLDTSCRSSSSVNLETTSSSQQEVITEIQSRIYRSASWQRLSGNEKYDAAVSHSRSRSQRSGRVWCQRPGIDVPPLPTILSPGHTLVGEENDGEFPLPESRGRPRSRSQDHRPRKLTKARPRPDVQMTTSFALG
ncbi:hypothetical protein N7486_008203 [Penicillium sp. IBT 16267x]|nr:hypothetical protein N7486_008203 [Penicillium sp. IBT 16267x]